MHLIFFFATRFNKFNNNKGVRMLDSIITLHSKVSKISFWRENVTILPSST